MLVGILRGLYHQCRRDDIANGTTLTVAMTGVWVDSVLETVNAAFSQLLSCPLFEAWMFWCFRCTIEHHMVVLESCSASKIGLAQLGTTVASYSAADLNTLGWVTVTSSIQHQPMGAFR